MDYSPELLRNVRLARFVTDNKFYTDFGDLLDELRSGVIEQVGSYGDDFFRISGVPGLVTHIINKASRIFSYVIRDRIGKGKFEDEVDDLLYYILYLKLYLEMLKREEGSGQ